MADTTWSMIMPFFLLLLKIKSSMKNHSFYFSFDFRDILNGTWINDIIMFRCLISRRHKTTLPYFLINPWQEHWTPPLWYVWGWTLLPEGVVTSKKYFLHILFWTAIRVFPSLVAIHVPFPSMVMQISKHSVFKLNSWDFYQSFSFHKWLLKVDACWCDGNIDTLL